MSAVAHLARLLAGTEAVDPPGPTDPSLASERLDAVIVQLERQARAGSGCREPVDLQRAVVERFWHRPQLDTLRDARLVAFGLGLPAGPNAVALLDDPGRLDAVLAAVDGWLANPRWYRRCFQGLVWSYFNAATPSGGPGSAGRSRLRAYLRRHLPATRDAGPHPDWVDTLFTYPSLLSESPSADVVGPLSRGDRTVLDIVCKHLDIGAGSWFLRDLLEAQVRHAAAADHPVFVAALPTLLALLEDDPWRDAGMSVLLERYARMPHAPLDPNLRDRLTRAWGNLWQPRDALAWAGIGDAARLLAGDWQKNHLIDQFFGSGQTRRAAFWKRYGPAIQRLDLVLPAEPSPRLQSVASGAACGMAVRWADAAQGAALVLTMGRARLVTFAEPDDGVWAYDLQQGAPFDLAERPAFELDRPNSLRLSRRTLCLMHRGASDGWRQWEQRFEAELKDRFGIRAGATAATDPAGFIDLSDPQGGPDTEAPTVAMPVRHSVSRGEDVHWQTAEAMSVPYSRPDLEVLARVHDLVLMPGISGQCKVRVAAGGVDVKIERVLRRWGFVRDGIGDWGR